MALDFDLSTAGAGELELRRGLGIPDAARQTLVFAESSHWDPDWLYTSQEYYDRWVRTNLEQAVEGLEQEPRRVYSVECLFFFRMFWDDHPEQRELLRALVNSRRLRLTSSGVTTADTLIPGPEAILRDFLLGQEWLRANGMSQEPRLAYFPDSFGCSHALPSLLNAAGFDQTGITRMDGMFFTGCDYELPSRYPWEGSTAYRLMKQERTLDFVWKDAEGGEVLCHWNAFTYGQGDMLCYSGASRVYLFQTAIPNRAAGHVARQVGAFARQLQPCSRTPYLFCPIGIDFVAPIPALLDLLDRYNREEYPKTGIWAVNAGLDDYLALVNCYRHQLPVIPLDPNPYWTGFYTARPSLKQLSHDLWDRLVLLDGLSMLNGPAQPGEPPAQAVEPEKLALPEADLLESTWWHAASSNHHDFITGTSRDRVVEQEQEPWLKAGIEVADAALANLGVDLNLAVIGEATLDHPSDISAGPSKGWEASFSILPPSSFGLPEWSLKDGLLEIRTPELTLELSEAAGGCITRARANATGAELLAGPSNDLVSFEDSGGLWRMGMEYPGGVFRERSRASQQPASLHVRPLPGELSGALEVTSMVVMEGRAFGRRLVVTSGSPALYFQVVGMAPENRTIVARFETGIDADRLVMDEPGGAIVRPVQKKFDPTFWPFQTFFQTPGARRGVVLFRGRPGAASCRAGRVDMVTHRNALYETAWGFVHFLGNPVRGHERAITFLDYGVLFTGPEEQPALGLLAEARRILAIGPLAPAAPVLWAAVAARLVEVHPPEVQVLAVKPAARGAGVIVRLYAPGRTGQAVSVRPRRWEARQAWLCDARERDLHPLPVVDGVAHLDLPGSIASLRFV